MTLSIGQFFGLARVDGKSMLPTYDDKELVVVVKDPKRLKRNDVIAIKLPSMLGKSYIKRIIGLPGDTIFAANGVLYVNGRVVKPIDKKQRTPTFSLLTSTGRETVPENKLFVLGDNRKYSTDSRSFGFVDYDDIIGKVGL